MEEVYNFINFLKGKFSRHELLFAKFVYDTDILSYTMLTDRVREGDKFVDKPNNILELSYLQLCAKKFYDSNEILEKLFLSYIGYSLRDYKNTWRLNLNNIDTDLMKKCSYCNVEINSCPFKLYTYIKKCALDSKFDLRFVFDSIVDRQDSNDYSNNPYSVQMIINAINDHVHDSIDIVAARMILATDLIKIEKVDKDVIHFKQVDLNVRDNSFYNNLYDYYVGNKGIDSEINVSDLHFTTGYSYLFNISPFEIAATIRYFCQKENLKEEDVVKGILEARGFRESELKVAYYNQYIHQIDLLECTEEEKNSLKEVITYIRNYNFKEELPYIHFNIGLYTKNTMLVDKVVGIINKFARTYGYIGNKGTMWIDTEMLVKRTKDSTDMIMQVDKIYQENDLIIFENWEKISTLNEFRVDALFTSIEKFAMRNRKSITVITEDEEIFKKLSFKHPDIVKNMINKKIYMDGYDAKVIMNKVIARLDGILTIDDGFKEKLESYIKQTYRANQVNEYEYIDSVYNEIVFNKFKDLIIEKSFSESDVPKGEDTREVDEILADINGLVGIPEVKSTINELIKYLDFTEKTGKKESANLNMLFKGNSGTGKTTVAKLLAELYYKLGFVKENKLIEVTSKDLIGTHLGETAPKTQAIVELALDGVLFIDEAYTIMASKGGSSSNYSAECIATLAKAIETYKDRLVVIFAGYTKEMNDFINANQGLMSRIGYEIEFPDFSTEELLEIFRREAAKNEFTIEDGVESRIKDIIIKNKLGRNFGNARFVINLFNRLVVIHATNCDENNLKTITVKDIDSYVETKKDKSRTVDEILSELNSLIGLKRVKETLNGFVSVIELNKKLNRTPDFNMHMIFKGNAGTGKTTVARLLAEIYYNLGYIKRNKLVEVQSQDLIGEFLGQTGPKTQAVIDSALDGVLFIDEAYAIMEHNGTNASYSAECVATLLKAMEDYRGRLIIIFAGYTEEMRKFRDLNPGLKSRVGYEIDFDDYSVDELMQIFDKKVADKEFKTDEDARKIVEKILIKAKEVENFGNGRFVDNMVQKIIVEHAVKTRGIDDMERLLTFTEEDIPEIKAEESRKRIGF